VGPRHTIQLLTNPPRLAKVILLERFLQSRQSPREVLVVLDEGVAQGSAMRTHRVQAFPDPPDLARIASRIEILIDCARSLCHSIRSSSFDYTEDGRRREPWRKIPGSLVRCPAGRPQGNAKRLASADRLPMAEETLRLLQQAEDAVDPGVKASARSNIAALLEEIGRNRITPAPETPDGVELLREDRRR